MSTSPLFNQLEEQSRQGRIPVIDPDGNPGTVPREQLDATLKIPGFKQAIFATSPKGESGLLPMDQAAAAIKDKGFTIGQATPKFNQEVGIAAPAPQAPVSPSPTQAQMDTVRSANEARPLWKKVLGLPASDQAEQKEVADYTQRVQPQVNETLPNPFRTLKSGEQAIVDYAKGAAESMDPANASLRFVPPTMGFNPSAGEPQPVDIGPQVAKAYKNVIAPATEGVVPEVAGLVDNPESLATLGLMKLLPTHNPILRLAQKAAAAKFGLSAAQNAVEKGAAGVQAAGEGNIPEAVKNLGGAAASTGFAAESGADFARNPGQTARDLADTGKTAGNAIVKATPASIGSRIYPESIQSNEQLAATEGRQGARQSQNLAAALEQGGQPEKGVRTFEDVAVPITDAIRTEAAKQGKTAKDFEGRNGYVAGKELTSAVRSEYDQAYDRVLEPIRDDYAGKSARVAAQDVMSKLSSDAQLIDELTNSGNLDQLQNLVERISKARTIGELDDIRQGLNRLGSRYFGKSEAQQSQSPILQEALAQAGNSIRDALYKRMEQSYGGMTVNGETTGVTEDAIRQLQREHGAAIKADQMMDAAGRALSSSESEHQAPPSIMRRLFGTAYRATLSRTPHAAAGVLERLFPGSRLADFNTQMKRVLEGGEPAGYNFPNPPITPEYVEPKSEGPTGTVPGGYKLKAAPPTIDAEPVLQKALPPGPEKALPPGQYEQPPSNEYPRRLGPIRLGNGLRARLTNSVEAAGIPQTAEPQALENVSEKRGNSVYSDPQTKRTIEQAGGKYLGSMAGQAQFNVDGVGGTTLSVPDNASLEQIQQSIESAKQRVGKVPKFLRAPQEAQPLPATESSPKAENVAAAPVEPQQSPEKSNIPAAQPSLLGTPQESELPGRSSSVRLMNPRELTTDPARFQWRQVPRNAIPESAPWDQTKAGPIDIWQDPKDGKWYVVEGHHRFNHAIRTNTPEVEVRSHQFQDANTAKAFGALRNIELGNATPFDAALYLRQTGLSADDLTAKGVNLTGEVAQKGAALSRLSETLWNDYRNGKLDESKAVAIGTYLSDPSQQAALAQLAQKQRLTAAEMGSLARRIQEQGNTETTSQGLFGADEHSISNAIERERMALKVEKELAQDKTALQSVARAGTKRNELVRAAGNIVNVDKTSEQAIIAAAVKEGFQRLQNRTGEVANLLDDAGKRRTQGEKTDAIFKEIYPQIRQAVLREISGPDSGGTGPSGQGSSGSESGRPTESAAPANTEPNQEARRNEASQSQGSIDLDRTPGPHGEPDSLLNSLANNVEFEHIQPQGRIPGHVVINQYGNELLQRAAGRRFVGSNMSVAGASRAISHLDDYSEQLRMSDPDAAARVKQFADTLEQAIDPKDGLNVIAKSPDQSEHGLRTQEEMFHSMVQRRPGSGDIRAGVPFEAMLRDDGIRQSVPDIEKMDPEEQASRVAEAVHDIFSGETELDAATAARTFERYLDALHEKHGLEPLRDAEALKQYIDQTFGDIISARGFNDRPGRNSLQAAIERNTQQQVDAGAESGKLPKTDRSLHGQSASESGVGDGESNRGDQGGSQETLDRGPQRGSMEWGGSGVPEGELSAFVKKGLQRIEEAGDQQNLFGQAEKMYRLIRADAEGQTEKVLVTRQQLDRLAAANPRVEKLMRYAGITQPTRPLFIPQARETPEEPNPQGSLFRVPKFLRAGR